MAKNKPTDDDVVAENAISRILVDLTVAISKTRSEDEQRDLVTVALDRLRSLYTELTHLFTPPVMGQIQDFKRYLALPLDAAVAKPHRLQAFDAPEAKRSVATPIEAVVLPTFVTVGDVLQGIGHAIRRAFPPKLWIKGEVIEYKRASSAHHYFSLIEHAAGGKQQVLPSVIWKSDWEQLEGKLSAAGVAIVTGQEMLFFGGVGLGRA